MVHISLNPPTDKMRKINLLYQKIFFSLTNYFSWQLRRKKPPVSLEAKTATTTDHSKRIFILFFYFAVNPVRVIDSTQIQIMVLKYV
jgi:hypothetical protein